MNDIPCSTVRCTSLGMTIKQTNTKINECNAWLEENVGKRWVNWCWTTNYGYVILPEEHATYFKLRFGV